MTRAAGLSSDQHPVLDHEATVHDNRDPRNRRAARRRLIDHVELHPDGADLPLDRFVNMRRHHRGAPENVDHVDRDVIRNGLEGGMAGAPQNFGEARIDPGDEISALLHVLGNAIAVALGLRGEPYDGDVATAPKEIPQFFIGWILPHGAPFPPALRPCSFRPAQYNLDGCCRELISPTSRRTLTCLTFCCPRLKSTLLPWPRHVTRFWRRWSPG